MINITKGLFQFFGKQSKIKICLQIGYPVTPSAPPSQSTSTKKSCSKLAAVYAVSQTSSVHVLSNSEKKITQFGWGAIKVLGPFYLDGFLCKHVGCTYLCLLCCCCNLLCQIGNLILHLWHPVDQFHSNKIQTVNVINLDTTLTLLLQVNITQSS